MAIFKKVIGWGDTIKGLQVIVSMLTGILIYRLAGRMGDAATAKRRARIVAGLYLLSPTQIFFTMSLWSECLYGALLLLALWVFLNAREGANESLRNGLKGAVLLGVLVGCCMLFRGVATYMIPIFAVGLLWRQLSGIGVAQVGAMMLGTVLTVGPYSLYATKKFDDVVITDRTLGQMMWLGNNDFMSITFDWGNGTLSRRAWKRHTSQGRKPCGNKNDAIGRDQCQTEAGVEWIKANPEEFVRRMPVRVAQLLNPHSFLTRHLRWGEWRGLPQFVDEALIMWNLGWSLLVMLVGSVGLCVRGRGASAILIGGILLYHIAAISLLAGLTRYRVPLEPLLMVFGGMVLADPRSTLAELSGWRLLLCVTVLTVVVPLVLWYLPTGWMWWRTW